MHILRKHAEGRTMIIKNTQQVLSHGNIEGRRVVLDIMEAGLRAPDPYPNVRKLVRVAGGRLIVGHPDFPELGGHPPLTFDLSEPRSIYVIGAGKAVQRIAEALEGALGDLITDGQINAKKGDTVRLKRIPVTLAGHPLPDEDSVRGATRILEIARRARKGDIVFSLDSGGGTALSALPAPGISLSDLQEVYRVLYFGSGANMPAANAVRNHIALVNTKHQRYVGDATLIKITSAEVPPVVRPHLYEPPKGANGHEAAIQVLREYHCWDKVPQSVRDFLLRADPQYGPIRADETAGKPHYFFRVMGPEYMLEAAQKRAEALGINTFVLARSLNDIETRPVAEALAHIAHEIEALGEPLRPPCLIISGGELVVAVGDASGRGGRNQEFVLAAAAQIAGSSRIVIASVDAEGTDGPTDVAGGIVDGQTFERIAAAGFDYRGELENHNSFGVLDALGDTLVTGIRGMNVRDLRLIYVGAIG
jgi:glycerate-2-kinase